jgi:hypothetical protein
MKNVVCQTLVWLFVLSLAACAGGDNAERSALHLPVYPRAVVESPPPPASDASGTHVIEVFSARAPFDDVYAWYQQHLPAQTQGVESAARRQATFALFDDRKRTVHLEGQGDRVVIYLTGTTAPAADSVSPAISKLIALPVYPAAEPALGGGVSRRMGASVVTAAYYHTAAPLAEVEGFYASKLPKGSLKAYIPASNSGVANFELTAGGAHKQVTLSADSSGTTIALVSTK